MLEYSSSPTLCASGRARQVEISIASLCGSKSSVQLSSNPELCDASCATVRDRPGSGASGTNFETGSESFTFPSAIRVTSAAAVWLLVIEPICATVSGVNGIRRSRSAKP